MRNVDDLSWDEFCIYLSGLNEKTPLGRVVSIRAEKDPKIVKEFTAEQKKIRKDWDKKVLDNMSDEDKKRITLQLQQSIISAFSSN